MIHADRRCDQCAHVDLLRGVHPMRCQHPQLQQSIPCSVMRAPDGRCGPGGMLFNENAGTRPAR